MIPVSHCSRTYPAYWNPYRELDAIYGEIDLPVPSLTTSVDRFGCHSVSANRLHELRGILDRLRAYSPAELELVWWMSQMDGHDARYAADTSGLMYLNAAVLAGQAARQIRLTTPFSPQQSTEQIAPVTGTRLDRLI